MILIKPSIYKLHRKRYTFGGNGRHHGRNGVVNTPETC